MSTKLKVLVFPCGTEIGLEIHNALKWSTHVELYGSSSVESNHGRYVYKNYLPQLPFVDAPDFFDQLSAQIREFGIDYVIPAHDSAVLALAEMSDKLPCPVIGSPAETAAICRSKAKTYELFKDKLTVPELFSADAPDLAYPLFLKPDVGEGSRGIHKVSSKEEIDFYLKQDPSLLVLEYLPGTEYTVDCFTDKTGDLKFVGPRIRTRISNGISADTASVANDERFQEIAETINGQLALRGAWFFQVKENAAGKLSILEIAPRIAGTMALYRNLGINFALLSIFDAAGYPTEISPLKADIRMDRALTNRYLLDIEYTKVYFDLDDTIICNGTINPMAVAFIFQCLNKNVNVHLITKHAQILEETLALHRIQNLFDDVIHIQNGEEKRDLIDPEGAIFIDDSFAERQKIAEAHAIPTFEPASLESLLDWRY